MTNTSVVTNNDFKIEVLNADRNSSDKKCSDQNTDTGDWMHVAKDLPYSDFKTVISVEGNLHRPGHWDLDDLMFFGLWWSCLFLSPVKLWQDGHSSSTLFGGTYCGKESC